jgi:hypothetical protein
MYFSVGPNIISKFRTITMFKSFFKQDNDLNTTYRYVHERLLYQTSLSEV